jgi:hypothetical protein
VSSAPWRNYLGIEIGPRDIFDSIDCLFHDRSHRFAKSLSSEMPFSWRGSCLPVYNTVAPARDGHQCIPE